MKKFLHLIIPIVILCVPLTIRYAAPDVLQELQLKVFDLYLTHNPRHADPQSPVMIVDIDDASLAQYGQWPWPRNVLSQLVDKLHALGASAIGFDMVFAEADRSSPSKLLDTLGDASQAIDPITLATLPNYDDMLAQSVAKGRTVLGYSLSDNAGKALPLAKYGMAIKGEDPLNYAYKHPYAVLNLPELERSAEGNGSFNVRPDADGMIRRVPLFFTMRDTLLPSLSAELLRVAQQASTYVITSEAHEGFTQVMIGDVPIPLNNDGSMWLHLSQYDKTRYISARALLAGKVKADQIQDRIVLIGTSAIGLKDMRATPLIPTINGVEIHAQAIEQILQQDFLSRPDWLQNAELLAMILAGVILLAALPRVSAMSGGVLTFIMLASAAYGAHYAFTHHGWLIDCVTPSLAIFLVYSAETLRRYASTEREKKHIRNAFSHYMSPALVKRLAAHPDALKLGGEMRDMSIMFCDIRGFTTISEQFDAQGLTRFINRFLTPMTSAILWRNGTIDKYIGDCIMAFWNAPLDDPHHAAHACEAALDMLEELRKLNQTLYEEAAATGATYIPVNIGIGINSGVCCVGNMGSAQRFDYSVLGDDVNLASRLEGQSKNYGVPVVIGQKTAEQSPNMASLEVDLIQVKGKTEAVRIYALFGGKELAASRTFHAFKEAFLAMLADFRAQSWQSALLNLKDAEAKARIALEAECPKELFSLYRERIELYRSTAHDEAWTGIHIAKTK
jgi:adenylate cyclase